MSARGWFGIVLVIGIGALAAFLWARLEGTPPEVQVPDSVLVGEKGAEVPLLLSDTGAGLRQLSVTLSHSLGDETLLERQLPGGLLEGAVAGAEPLAIAVAIDAGKLPRTVEDGFLRISVRDWSWRDRLRGNETRLDVPVVIDRKPPRVGVATGLTYVRRGGAGVVVYTMSEPASRDGVRVGDAFFDGFPLGERRVAFYAVPTDAPKNPTIRVVAEDVAGNRAEAGWPVVVNERDLPRSDIKLPASFLENKVGELARSEGIEAADQVQAFQRINTELRARNEAQIREVLSDSADERLWEGAFAQLQNSKVTSRFAEKRRYLANRKPVSEATHFGYDLASTAAAPVTAAAAGRVAFAGELGIYGNCVILDHGLGLASLYGHLSRLDVGDGDAVARGQVLGLSGSTGLAGGDHLHFAVLVGGVYVDPLEWWDPKWVSENVEARLAPPTS